MTGGMDSRLTLAGDLAVDFAPILANWQGSPIYMNTKYDDYVVCEKIARENNLEFVSVDVSGDEPHAIDSSMLELLGEYATIYGNNLNWHEIFKTQFFQLNANSPHIQPVCQWCKDFNRLAGNLFLLFWRLKLQRLHIMQAVGQLDDDNSNVATDGNH